ncbi:MAG: Phosphoglycerate mutase [Actinomycetia bacterium]|nr:Phosphoglycerate mutase [Actinomycetes bacterium]
MKRPRTLFLVRHGESGWNRKRLIQGQSRAAPGLTAAGREDAVAAAGDLADSGAVFILASDLRRAVETALPIAARLGVPVRLEPRLRERLLGTAEGRPSDQVDPGELGVTGMRITDPDACPPGGESVRQLYDRVTSLLGEPLSSSPGDAWRAHPRGPCVPRGPRRQGDDVVRRAQRLHRDSAVRGGRAKP